VCTHKDSVKLPPEFQHHALISRLTGDTKPLWRWLLGKLPA
jgi:hypothetical protein